MLALMLCCKLGFQSYEVQSCDALDLVSNIELVDQAYTNFRQTVVHPMTLCYTVRKVE